MTISGLGSLKLRMFPVFWIVNTGYKDTLSFNTVAFQLSSCVIFDLWRVKHVLGRTLPASLFSVFQCFHCASLILRVSILRLPNCSLTNLSIVGNNKNLTGLLLHSTCQAISSRAGAGVVVSFFGSAIAQWTDCSYSFNPFTLSWPLG